MGLLRVRGGRSKQSEEPAPFGWPKRRDGDFLLDDGATLTEDVACYLAACERSREIFAGVSLDDVCTHHRFGDLDVRCIMMHRLDTHPRHPHRRRSGIRDGTRTRRRLRRCGRSRHHRGADAYRFRLYWLSPGLDLAFLRR
ncbi:DUF664 domain-containing protein [Streptomyces sporangiiformans]|uniref:DUF664 domain-containing protein n=1 Tax=Streptomyces sporangiiformans TaxID=2315329 RepID=A0A505DSB5_9ACTN|nr:DUF664 domain-containing protein [Streptomyces sporangiiformans]